VSNLLPGADPNPRRPSVRFPQGACDCHAHVFGPETVYPYAGHATYRFPVTTLEDYERMHAIIGCTRGVLVQPSVYGTDNRCMTDALKRRPDTLRGVAVVAPDVGMAELEELHACGVRGIRINIASPTEGLRLEHAAPLAQRIAALGWHLQFFFRPEQAEGLLAEVSKLPVPCVVDHFGHIKASEGRQAPGFQSLLALARLDHVWFKLMGPYRVSTQPPYFPDVATLAAELIDAAPDRCVWATDWPHPNAVPVPNDGDLADALAQWAVDPELRKRILVANPARLYGFGPL
jgi:predicted TIM-barrel fold metal-dependent hydrolase